MPGAIPTRLLCLAGLAAALAWPKCAVAADPEAKVDSSPNVQRLVDFGLTPTTESLASYLASLVPTAERKAELQRTIAQLGDDEFTRREQATLLLKRQAVGAADVLQQAIAGDDYEIRWRARQILDQTDHNSRALLSAALAVVHERKLPGLCQPLVATLPLCQDDGQRAALRRALAATATPESVPFLREQLAAPDPRARVAAIATLAVLLGSAADADARHLLRDSTPAVQVAAARVLADHGRRESLEPLVRLLESSETGVRVEASRTLRAVTGQHWGYTAYDAPDRRAPSLAAWRKWLESESATAPLHFPLDDTPADLGRLLVCDHRENMLLEFDTAGRRIWRQAVGAQPWACLGLPNGHRLVGSFNDKSVVEYDVKGVEVWRVSELPAGPTSIQRLENGNTLIACTEAQQVVEIDAAKKIVWTAALEGRPVDARRLEDGRTLVTLQHGQKIVEVDTAGKQVWEIAGVGMAFSAERLENGNTLVAAIGHNQVREYDRLGKAVWSQGKFVNPYSAQRLASGNTVVVDTSGVTEIDAQGAVVFHLALPNLSRMWRY